MQQQWRSAPASTETVPTSVVEAPQAATPVASNAQLAEQIAGTAVETEETSTLAAVAATETPAPARPAPRTQGDGVIRREVEDNVSERIEGAANPAWNGRYSWESNFAVAIDRAASALTIEMRLRSSAGAETKAAWEQAIEAKWGGGIRTLEVLDAEGNLTDRLAIHCDIKWVEDRRDAHYTVTPNTPGTTADGRAGLGGTTSMTGWGVNDTVDVTHEFGHMLGAVEDYFITNGEDHTHGGTRRGFRDPGAGIMNNPEEMPLPDHYDLVRRGAARALRVPETRCRVV